MAEGLVPITLPYNLDELRAYLQAPAPDAGGKQKIKRQPTNYLFNPAPEKLIEVGEHGLLLLKPCTGKYSLGDILAALGEQNRGPALDFYLQLAAAGFLHWEQH
jgi:hypothetical protein